MAQTSFLANAINLASKNSTEYQDVYSATGGIIFADEAVRASERIPESLGAFDAAHEFTTYFLRNLRETEERASGEKMRVPSWFARS